MQGMVDWPSVQSLNAVERLDRQVFERQRVLPISATEVRTCKKSNQMSRNPYPDRINETDHHEPGPTLPFAMAVIDPKRKNCRSGLDYLAGVGVAFFHVMALKKFFREKNFRENMPEPNLTDYLDLFAIGTIGDMMPLINVNRVLCFAGLKKIKQGTRLGLKFIAQSSRIDLKKIDSDDISFKIVPRINAAGRISHARICVSLLMATDINNAEKTALLLDNLNIKRQRIEQEIVLNIEHCLEKNPVLLEKNCFFYGMTNGNWAVYLPG